MDSFFIRLWEWEVVVCRLEGKVESFRVPGVFLVWFWLGWGGVELGWRGGKTAARRHTTPYDRRMLDQDFMQVG